jgi:glycosyltransferase involved in cell wall biosynthesis
MSAYNAEKTINKAINSILNQTYKDFELIIVNDCSTDSTKSIIESYTDNRLKLINHDVNLGAGYARDTGIKNCSGEYIQFVDSDDYLSPEYLNTCIKAIKKYDADIIVSGLIVENSDYIIQYHLGPEVLDIQTEEDRFKPTGFWKRMLLDFFFKKSLFDTIEYSHRRYCEDTPTLFKLLYLANKVVEIPYFGYHYTQQSSSLTHTCSKAKGAIYHCLAAKDNTVFLRERGEEMDDSLFLTMYDKLKEFSKEELYSFAEEMEEIDNFLKTTTYGKEIS